MELLRSRFDFGKPDERARAADPTRAPHAVRLDGWLYAQFIDRSGTGWWHFGLESSTTLVSQRIMTVTYRRFPSDRDARSAFASEPTSSLSVLLDAETWSSFRGGHGGSQLVSSIDAPTAQPTSLQQVVLVSGRARSPILTLYERLPQCVYLANWLSDQGCSVVSTAGPAVLSILAAPLRLGSEATALTSDSRPSAPKATATQMSVRRVAVSLAAPEYSRHATTDAVLVPRSSESVISAGRSSAGNQTPVSAAFNLAASLRSPPARSERRLSASYNPAVSPSLVTTSPVPHLAPHSASRHSPATFGARAPPAMPFTLWFSALRAWPGLRSEAMRAAPDSNGRPAMATLSKVFIGFGRVVDVRRSDKYTAAVLEISFDGLDPVWSQRSPLVSAEAMRVALEDLASDDDDYDHRSASLPTANWDLTAFLDAINSLSPKDVGTLARLKTNEQSSCVSGGGSFAVGDVVAALIKGKPAKELAPPKASSSQRTGTSVSASRDKRTRCKFSFSKCKRKDLCWYSHTDEEVRLAEADFRGSSPKTPQDSASGGVTKLRWYVDGVVRLQCSSASVDSAAAAWRCGTSAAPDSCLASLAAAQQSESFLRDLARLLGLSDGARPASAATDTADAPLLRIVLAALLSQSKTWERLESALSRTGPDANAALALLTSAAHVTDGHVLAAGARKLQRCIVLAASLPALGASGAAAIGALVAVLASRLSVSHGRAPLESSAMRMLHVAAKRESSETHWLDVPLVPTVADIQGGAKWLGPGRLAGLEKVYPTPQAYLERLFRLLRADALADISLRVGVLARGDPVPDRELRRFTDLRVEGYRARGGAVQVALSFRPVTKPRGGNCATAHLLMDGSLVCIAPRGRWRNIAALLWAVVAPARDALERGVVVVEVLPGTGVDAMDVLRALLTAPPGSSEMVENPEFFTSARFALERLRALGSANAVLPFESELVRAEICLADGFGPSGSREKWSSTLRLALKDIFHAPRLANLNEEQQETVAGGLQNRVWISQGPPGTGKTTASVSFFSALQCLPADERSKRPTLMLAVKNHALDQFLERVMIAQPGTRVVRIGGKAVPALAELNLSVLRKAADDACRARRTDVMPGVLEAWRAKGKAYSDLISAQEALADALDASLGGGGAPDPDKFLATLSATQLRDLVLGARDGLAASCIRVPGIDLVGAWSEQAAGLRLSCPSDAAESAAFSALLDNAPSLIELGVLDAESLDGAEVVVRKKGKKSALRLPRLRDVVSLALKLWASEIAGAEVLDMFEMSSNALDDDREQLLLRRGREGSACAPADTSAPDVDGNDDVDAILREARAAALLDDDDDSLGDVDVLHDGITKSTRRRRPAARRDGVPGVIDDLHMSRLGSSITTDGHSPLAACDFVSRPLRAIFAEIFAESVDDIAGSPIWDLSSRGRAFLLHRAAMAQRSSAERAYADTLPVFREAALADADARAAFDAAVVSRASVVGMTINGAAKVRCFVLFLLSQFIPQISRIVRFSCSTLFCSRSSLRRLLLSKKLLRSKSRCSLLLCLQVLAFCSWLATTSSYLRSRRTTRFPRPTSRSTCRCSSVLSTRASSRVVCESRIACIRD